MATNSNLKNPAPSLLIKSLKAFDLPVFMTAIFSLLIFMQPGLAEVERQTDAQLDGLPHSHLNVWLDRSVEHRGVIIAMHGLIMHGGVFDTVASNLAEKGFIVLAADMRGYGRWKPDLVERVLAARNDSSSDLSVKISEEGEDIKDLTEEPLVLEESDSFLKSRSRVRYNESFKDLLALTRAVDQNYPQLPVFLMGESMGAGMAIHVAGEAPECVDGMILSSPAIKKKINLAPRILLDAARFCRHPHKPVDLKPYILKFSSEDPLIARACAGDPLVRKSLRPGDLLRTSREIGRNISYADLVPPEVPVLIIQGDRDRMVKSNGVVTLLQRLKSKDQTVKWFPNKGHLLLETPYVTDETLDVVTGWLNQHVQSYEKAPGSLSSLLIRSPH